MTKPFQIYIGYDEVESVAWHTLTHSILSKSTIPVSFSPIKLSLFKDFFERPRHEKQSNEFSFSRFLVPHMQNFQGLALFVDCDMMFRVDISTLLDAVKLQDEKAVYVVKHDYTPSENIKYLNTVQYAYPRKNWSSFVVWNCSHPKNRALSPQYVETASGLELHRFTWLDDDEIGELDVRWNWLVGDYKNPPNDVYNVHWTNGGPYFNEYATSDFSDEWRTMNFKANFCQQRSNIK